MTDLQNSTTPPLAYSVRPALRRAGIVAQKFKIVQMLNRITQVDYSTSARLLQNWLLAVVIFIHSLNCQLCQ